MPANPSNCIQTRAHFNSSLMPHENAPHMPNFFTYSSPTENASVILANGYFNTLRDLPDTDPRKIKTGDVFLIQGMVPIDQNNPNGVGYPVSQSISALYPNTQLIPLYL